MITYHENMKKNLPSVISASKARSNFYTLIDEVGKGFKRFTITLNGGAQAMLIHPDEVESWEETLEIMSDKETVEGIRKGIEDFEAGRVISWEELLNGYNISENELK